MRHGCGLEYSSEILETCIMRRLVWRARRIKEPVSGLCWRRTMKNRVWQAIVVIVFLVVLSRTALQRDAAGKCL